LVLLSTRSPQTAQLRSGRTIEEVVSELIRPMLKT
jgi:cell pole-organizing protein PopZ